MKPKNGLPLLLPFMLFVCFAFFPTIAHATQQKGSEPPQAAQSVPSHTASADQRDAQRTITGPFRITYTITEMDGGRRVGSNHYALVLDAGRQHAESNLKLGSRVPITTTDTQATPKTPIQFTYVDIGIDIRASLLKVANGLELSTHVRQSSIDSQDSPSKRIAPVIREVSFDSSALLQENKPVQLGTVSMPGSTHVLQIQAEVTKVQ